MSYIEIDKVQLADPALDAFSRVRTSTPHTLFDCKFSYSKDSGAYHEHITGTAAGTYLPDESSVELSVGSALGDKISRETNRYFQYQPGKSLLVLLTGVLGAPKAGVVSRIGYFDIGDGYYFSQNESGPAIVERSSISGSVVETIIAQASWNIDTMDGTGPSGITIDFSKAQIFIFDLQWLGVGRVRCYLDIDGKLVPVHEFLHANILTSVYISSPNLPCTYELENITATASPTTMKQICTSVLSEGGYNPAGDIYSADIGLTPKAIPTTSWTPVMSFQLKSTLNSKTVRGYAEVVDISILNTSADSLVFAMISEPALTGATFNSVNSSSIMTADTSATAYTGGTVRNIKYVGANDKATNAAVYSLGELSLYARPSADTPKIHTIAARSIGGANSILFASTWREIT